MKKYYRYIKEIKTRIKKECFKKWIGLKPNAPSIIILLLIVVMVLYLIFKWKENDWDAVTASLSVIVALLAIWTVLKTNDSSRFCTGADLLVRLEERFISEEMKEKRKKAIEAIQKGRYGDNSVSTILDFFSVIAILAYKNVLDKEMIWRTFSSWLIPYYHSLKDYIENERKEKNDKKLYETLSKLYNELAVAFETKESLDKLIGKEEIEEFYKDEISLCL